MLQNGQKFLPKRDGTFSKGNKKQNAQKEKLKDEPQKELPNIKSIQIKLWTQHKLRKA